jgi:hypothetical protein
MDHPNRNISGLRPVKKGEVLNPKGRPKGARNRQTIARFWLEAMQSGKNPISGKTEELSQADWVLLALLAKARKGDVPAIKELMDSGYGKIADKSDVTIGGDAENPLAFANLRGLSDEELATMTALLEKAAGGKTTE